MAKASSKSSKRLASFSGVLTAECISQFYANLVSHPRSAASQASSRSVAARTRRLDSMARDTWRRQWQRRRFSLSTSLTVHCPRHAATSSFATFFVGSFDESAHRKTAKWLTDFAKRYLCCASSSSSVNTSI